MTPGRAAAALGPCLARRGMTLALAESCTGGLVGATLTAVPGSSRFFLGSVVAYHDRVKRKVLKVPPTILRRAGAVSAPAALAMARGVRKATGATVGLSITGIAGPGGGTPEKPVGLVYIGLAARGENLVFRFLFTGTRARVRRDACLEALARLSAFLEAL